MAIAPTSSNSVIAAVLGRGAVRSPVARPEPRVERIAPVVRDRVEISPEARRAAAEEIAVPTSAPTRPEATEEETSPSPTGTVERGADGEELSEGEQTQVRELQQRDQEVRRHEQAHKSAGGPYAGGIQYEYETGPDGKRYATGGSVPIDVSPVADDPQATIAKMQVVRRAALAPAEPSAADRRVAQQAARNEQRARSELLEKRRLESSAESADGTGESEDVSGADETATSGPDRSRPNGFEEQIRSELVKRYASSSGAPSTSSTASLAGSPAGTSAASVASSPPGLQLDALA